MPRPWPITYEDVVAARERIRPDVPATPLRRYVELDRAVGAGVRVLVKHENQTAAVVFSGGNIDEDTLRRILNHEV